MTIAIAFAVLAVLTVIGIWWLRRQAAFQRDFGPPPRIEDGPPSGQEDPDTARSTTEVPWHEADTPPEGGDGTGGTPRTVVEEPISSAAPDALDALEKLEHEPPAEPQPPAEPSEQEAPAEPEPPAEPSEHENSDHPR
jgi:hypothetical protein